MKRVYLCGGIFGLSDDGAKTWREYAKEKLAGVASVVDPMVRDYRGMEDANVVAIVEDDRGDIEGCTHLLVNASMPSWGTAMEVFYAYSLGVQVWAFGAPKQRSPWLTYHTHKFGTLESLVADIAETPNE